MMLREWAAAWGIPWVALSDLEQRLGLLGSDLPPQTPGAPPTHGSEAYLQSRVRLEAAKSGILATRNNVGALQDKAGRLVRFGLFHETEKQNARIKSGDLIGIKRVEIKPQHVGNVVGQFWMRECKEIGWHYSGTEREVAQLNCINLINSYGGDAAFVSTPGTI